VPETCVVALRGLW